MAFLRTTLILIVLAIGMAATAQEKVGAEGQTAPSQAAPIVIMRCNTDSMVTGSCFTARPANTEGMECECGNPFNGHYIKGTLYATDIKLVCETESGLKCVKSGQTSAADIGSDCSCTKNPYLHSAENLLHGTYRPPFIGDSPFIQ